MIQNYIIELIYYYLPIEDIYICIQVNKQFLNVYRTLNINFLTDKVETKNEKLDILFKFYKHLPKQGSIEWKELKKGNIDKPPTIGGSEMYNLIKYPRTLVYQKISEYGFKGNKYTQWGNIFENITTMFFEILFNNKINEVGSIPGIRNEQGFPIQSYSPDGLIVIKKRELIKIINHNFNDISKEYKEKYNKIHETLDDELIVLNEIKSPATRIPNGEIPDKYIYQPSIGLCTIPITDLSLFIDVVYRKCSFDDFNYTNNYDTNFHNSDDSKLNQSPHCLGMFCIYEKTKNIDRLQIEKVDEISLNLYNKILEDKNKKGSITDFEINSKNIETFIKICYKFLSRYKISNSENDWHINDNKQVVFRIMKYLYKDQTNLFPNIKKIIKINDMFIEDLELSYIVEKLDLGNKQASYLDPLFRRVVENREKENKDIFIYYSPGLIIYSDLINKLNIQQKNIAENYLDPTKGKNQCQDWLYRNIKIFYKFCLKKNYKIVGFLPWKMFKVCIIPVYRNPVLIEQFIIQIRKAVSVIQELRKLIHENNIEIGKIKDFYNDNIHKYYPFDEKENKKIFDEKNEDNKNILSLRRRRKPIKI